MCCVCLQVPVSSQVRSCLIQVFLVTCVVLVVEILLLITDRNIYLTSCLWNTVSTCVFRNCQQLISIVVYIVLSLCRSCRDFTSSVSTYVKKHSYRQFRLSEVFHMFCLSVNQYSDSLRAGRSGDRIPVGARFSSPFQIGSGAHPASWRIGTESLSRRVKRRGNDVDHPPNGAPRLKKEQSYTCTPHLGLHGLLQGELYFYLSVSIYLSIYLSLSSYVPTYLPTYPLGMYRILVASGILIVDVWQDILLRRKPVPTRGNTNTRKMET